MSFVGSEESAACIPCTQEQYFDLLDWSSRLVVEGKRGFVDSNQPALLEQLSFRGEQWQTLCTSLGKLSLGAIGTTEHVAHFHQARGKKRTPRSSPITQLFA